MEMSDAVTRTDRNGTSSLPWSWAYSGMCRRTSLCVSVPISRSLCVWTRVARLVASTTSLVQESWSFCEAEPCCMSRVRRYSMSEQRRTYGSALCSLTPLDRRPSSENTVSHDDDGPYRGLRADGISQYSLDPKLLEDGGHYPTRTHGCTPVIGARSAVCPRVIGHHSSDSVSLRLDALLDICSLLLWYCGEL